MWKIGFGYEQADLDDVSRCRGLYIYDDQGIVVFSEDVQPTESQVKQLQEMVLVPRSSLNEKQAQ
jgi:hypothetical protein